MSSKPLVHLFVNYGDDVSSACPKSGNNDGTYHAVEKGSYDLRDVTCKQCLGTDLRFSVSDRAWTQHINQIRQEKYLKER